MDLIGSIIVLVLLMYLWGMGVGGAIWTTTSSGILVIMNESVNTDGTLNCNLKGDAAFWWNLKRSGDGDVSTRHAGCPVLVGSKWGE